MTNHQGPVGLEKFPEELLVEVFSNLEPIRRYTCPSYEGRAGQLTPVGGEGRLRENRQRIRALAALCRVSKKYLRVCQPILYRAFITNGRPYATVLILRTLLRNKHLWHHIQYVEFNKWDVLSSPIAAFSAAEIWVFAAWDDVKTLSIPSHSDYGGAAWRTLFQDRPDIAAVTLIVSLAQNLRHLYLACTSDMLEWAGLLDHDLLDRRNHCFPLVHTLCLEKLDEDEVPRLRHSHYVSDPDASRPAVLSEFPSFKHLDIYDTAIEISHAHNERLFSVLHQLETLRIWPCVEIIDLSIDEIVSACPNLRIIQLHESSTAYGWRLESINFELSNLTVLSLIELTSYPFDFLCAVISGCHSLRVLDCRYAEMVLDGDSDSAHLNPEAAPITYYCEVLNAAPLYNVLLLHKLTLEYFHMDLSLVEWENIEVFDLEESFSEFARLKHMGLNPFFYKWQQESLDGWTKTLPPSLESLKLSGDGLPSEKDLSLLNALAADCKNLPALKEIQINDFELLLQEYDELRNIFQRNGVKFEYAPELSATPIATPIFEFDANGALVHQGRPERF